MAQSSTTRTPKRLSALVAKPFDSIRHGHQDKDISPAPRRGRARSPYPPFSSYDPHHDYHFFPPPPSTAGPAASLLPQPSVGSLESDWVAIKAQAFMKTGVVDVFGNGAIDHSRPGPPVTPRPDDVSCQQIEPEGDASDAHHPVPPAEIRNTWARRVYKRIQGNKLRKAASAVNLNHPRRPLSDGEEEVHDEPGARREHRPQFHFEARPSLHFSRSKIFRPRDIDSESDFGHDPIPEQRLSAHRILTFDSTWAGDGADLGINGSRSDYHMTRHTYPKANALQLDGVPAPAWCRLPSPLEPEPQPPAPPVPPKDRQYLARLDNCRPVSAAANSPTPLVLPRQSSDSPETYDDPLVQTPDLISGYVHCLQPSHTGLTRAPAHRPQQHATRPNLPLGLHMERSDGQNNTTAGYWCEDTAHAQEAKGSAWWDNYPPPQVPSMPVPTKPGPPPARPPRPDAKVTPSGSILQRTPPPNPTTRPTTPYRSPPQVRIAPSPPRPATASSRYRHFLSGRGGNRISAQFPVFTRKPTLHLSKVPHTEENCPHQENGLVCLRNRLAAEVLSRHPTSSSTARRCLEWSAQVEPGLPEDQQPPPLSPSLADAEMSLLGLLRTRLNLNDADDGIDTLTIPSIRDDDETNYETALDQ